MKKYLNIRKRTRLEQFATRLSAATILNDYQQKQMNEGGVVTIPLGLLPDDGQLS